MPKEDAGAARGLVGGLEHLKVAYEQYIKKLEQELIVLLTATK